MSSIKVLFLTANPRDITRLNLRKERDEIEHALHISNAYSYFDIQDYWDAQANGLLENLTIYKPQIVHFSGHSNNSSEIILLNEYGEAVSIPVHTIRKLFSLRRTTIRCVILNACFSEVQASEISKYIDCVIGTSSAIDDKAAIVFSKAFYRSLGDGDSIKSAFDSGCLEVELSRLDDPNKYQLLAPTVDPSKIVLLPKSYASGSFIPLARIPEKGSNLPYRHPNFVGRQNEINRIMEALASRSWIIAVDGIGGIGKTSLALEVAHICKENSDKGLDAPYFSSFVWTSARDNPNFGLQDVIRQVLNVLPRETNNEIIESKSQADLAIEALSEKPCLLVIDNFETVQDNLLHRFIRDKIPPPSKVIITSRHHAMAGEFVVTIGGLEDEDAYKLLRNEANRLQIPLSSQDSSYLGLIIRKAYGIPLVLRWVMESVRNGKTLEWVLKSLDQATAHDIYNFIFEYSLSLLDPETISIFCSMALLPTWCSINVIMAINPYVSAIESRISKLVTFSLLEDNQSLVSISRRYKLPDLARNLASHQLANLEDKGKTYIKNALQFFLQDLSNKDLVELHTQQYFEDIFPNIENVIIGATTFDDVTVLKSAVLLTEAMNKYSQRMAQILTEHLLQPIRNTGNSQLAIQLLSITYEPSGSGSIVAAEPSPPIGSRIPHDTKVKILFLAANPSDTSRLTLDQESRSVSEKLRGSEYRESFDIRQVWTVRPDDLLQSLNVHKPQILHFSGHGSNTEEIMLADISGVTKPVSASALEALFTALKDNIHLVILSGCYSQAQAVAIVDVIDFVIGINSAIGDEAAITFVASFYRALGFGRSLLEAFNQGLVALLLKGIPEEHLPELLCKSGVSPESVVFV